MSDYETSSAKQTRTQFTIPVVDLTGVPMGSPTGSGDDITMWYSEEVRKLGITLFELLSEALELKPDHLMGMDCAKGHVILGHYYPTCPEPELNMGTTNFRILISNPPTSRPYRWTHKLSIKTIG
ncbi:hypothetical protein FNV43_RR01462 [Rhamnella rubrinervis]|uniref:Uncharacterized protein n=1 Tax=Rhamnella rubrinervis TaxID=2594499 RepID=A0A8K0HSG1_9ROSA|nr:hypothetical protein FNV43_RR01462 [Rhamnella rubrinervis]